MNHRQILFLLFTVFTCISVGGFSQQRDAKANQQSSEAEGLQDCFRVFLEKQRQIEFIRYEVQRTDSFATGKVRCSKGVITLKADTNNPGAGFSYHGRCDGCAFEEFYVNDTLFTVHLEKKFYFIKPRFGKFLSGTECGPLVLPELIRTDTSGTGFTLFATGDHEFAFQTAARSGTTVSTRQVTINKSTCIPTRIQITKLNTEQAWKQSVTFDISHVQLNGQITGNKLLNLHFRTGYAMIRDAEAKNTDSLIGRKVPEIVLHTFNNGPVNIRSLEGRIVLLDFWEKWCSPCKKSLPAVDAIANAYQPYGLVTFGVIYDTVNASAYLKEHNITVNQVKGTLDLNAIFMINSYPRYVLINRKGRIEKIYFGFSDGLEPDINWLLFE